MGKKFTPSQEVAAEWLGMRVDADQALSSSTFVQLRNRFISQVQSGVEELLGVHANKEIPPSTEYPYFRFIPALLGAVRPDEVSFSWSAPCFQSNTAIAAQNEDGTFNLTVTTNNPTSAGCSDFYLFATLEGVLLHTFTQVGTVTFPWALPADVKPAELWDIQNNGFRVMLFQDSFFPTLNDILQTALLFLGDFSKTITPDIASRNIDFLTKYSGFAVRNRTITEVTIDPSLVHSGDFVGVMRLDGLDPMLAWAMGSTTGHATVALRFDGVLHICESTTVDAYWPTNGIQCHEWNNWLQLAKAAGHNVVWAPLSAEARAQFNETAAVEFFKAHEGLDYGYHTLLWGWLDTVQDNYPCLPTQYNVCLEWGHVEVLFGLLDRFAPFASQLLFNQAMNLRLNTWGLGVAEILYTSAFKGIDSAKLSTFVELDSYRYNMTRNGEPVFAQSQVCCVFVCNIWKAGGLFENLDNEVNCGELTNWDDYALNILTVPNPRPAACQAADPTNQLCQLEGQYTLNLNNYATKTPYAHMAEQCPSQAPHYNKPPNC